MKRHKSKARLKKLLASVIAAVTLCTALIAAPSATAAESGFNIGVVDFDAALGSGNEEANLAKIEKYINECADEDELILFPEYSLASSPEDAVNVQTNSSVNEIASLADNTDTYVIFGSVIKESGKIYSAMIICDPDGNKDVYKKIHITDEQYADGFSAGTTPYVLSTPYGNFGIAMGNEFAESAEIGKYFYGKACRMILVGQSYGYDPTQENALTQAEYDMYTATYAYLRMYSRPVAVANLYTSYNGTEYFGESHVCTAYQNGWIAGGNESQSAPAKTNVAGVSSANIPESQRDTTNGMASRRLNLLADWYNELNEYEMPVYGEGSSYEDNIKVASVNFHAVWGDLDTNVAKIESLMSQAADEGVQLLVFPEMALTAYSVVLPEDYTEEERALFGDDYMQHVLAQTVRGDNPSPIITELQQLAESYGMYVVIGLPERDENDPDEYWNSVAILGPNLRQSYRKVNLASPEPNWASYGTTNEDGIFETEYGLIGVAICADIYNYQELQRTFAERGCRIAINCTAGAANNTTVENGGWQLTYQNRLESFMLRDDTFMITSNLVGYEGPKLTGELLESLTAAGYTQDDITSSWLVSSNTDLYNLLYSYNEESNKYERKLNSRACVFPGSSVCIALDPNSTTGTTVYGNTTDSSALINYDGTDLGPYLDIDGDGRSPYINYTTDTFDTYVAADFDLSLATLSNFYGDNPYAYRPDLYAQWYAELFYETAGISVSEKTLADPSTLLMVTGNMVDATALNVSTSSADAESLDGYTPISATSYNVSLTASLTTDVLHTSSANTAYGATTTPYTGSYAPALGEISVKIPVSGCDKAIALVDGEKYESENGTISFTVDNYTKLSDFTVAAYNAEEVATDPETNPATDPVTEPETDSATDPVTDPETDPATDPVTDPVTDPITDSTDTTDTTNATSITDATSVTDTTSVTNATNTTNATSATNAAKSANTTTTSSTNSGNTATGKVATDDNGFSVIVLAAILTASGVIAFAAKRKREK